MRRVLLVDTNGHVIGSEELSKAHAGTGLLHRAFSVFIFRKGRNELLIQQRSAGKPLFPLLWANTCCSHLREGETVKEAGVQRLKEELGITCDLKEGPSFVYHAEDPQGNGAEFEYDTVLIGKVQGDPEITPDPAEVNAFRWVNVEELTKDMHLSPLSYAPWFHLGLPMIMHRTASK